MTLGEGLSLDPMTLDPITLAVVRNRLEQVVDEMDATLFRSAFNPIIAEARDASHGLYDPLTGDTLAQGKSGLPIFVGAMAFAVGAVIAKAKRDGDLADGDVYIFNDPYDGGTHLSDFKLVRPFYRGGRLFCWLASVGHWHDVGGNVPGNYNPAATECFQEGVLIPPVKLFRAGVLDRDIVDILTANSRLPRSAWGDLNGQINALDRGIERLSALIEDMGEGVIAAALAELRQRAARMMRAHIAALPDGTWSADDFLDNDGIIDEPLRIALDLTIAGERMTLDFSRSSPACAGPVNIARSTAIAACYVALKHVFTDVPANAGVLDPIAFVIDDKSLLAVRAPKPVGGYTETILRMIDVIFAALGQAVPDRVSACAYGTINALSMAGQRTDACGVARPEASVRDDATTRQQNARGVGGAATRQQSGGRWLMFSFFGGGHGGHAEGDGLNHGNAPISTATIPPVEILEAAYPVVFRQWALRPDSGGAGRHRGGLGAVYEIELDEDKADLFLFGERARHAPPGIAGGSTGALNRLSVIRRTGAVERPPMGSKWTGVKLERGDRVRLESPGGGGWGDPAERSADDIAADIAAGYVTRPDAGAPR